MTNGNPDGVRPDCVSLVPRALQIHILAMLPQSSHRSCLSMRQLLAVAPSGNQAFSGINRYTPSDMQTKVKDEEDSLEGAGGRGAPETLPQSSKGNRADSPSARPGGLTMGGHSLSLAWLIPSSAPFGASPPLDQRASKGSLWSIPSKQLQQPLGLAMWGSQSRACPRQPPRQVLHTVMSWSDTV